MKQGLSLRTAQSLTLSPQLQQTIKLLQLSTIELEGEIQTMLEENPFLEREDENQAENFGLNSENEKPNTNEDTADPQEAPQEQADTPENWDGDGSIETSPDDGEWGGEAPAANEAGQELDPLERAATSESLHEHLHKQALASRLTEEDMAAVRFIIESLDEEGYLTDTLAQLAATLLDDEDGLEEMQELIHRLTMAHNFLQSFEPAGVGATSLAHCLALQIKRQQEQDPENQDLKTALKICTTHGALEQIAKKETKKLAQELQTQEETITNAIQIIAKLDPKPARKFSQAEKNIIIPDVIVTSTGNGENQKFKVELNQAIMPKLRIQQHYANAMRKAPKASKETKEHQDLGHRLQEARWFIKSVQQRFDTILRVSKIIIKHQKNFLTKGVEGMRPLVQREIAEELGVHESTISRVTTAKYISTPQGTYELKHFFSSAVGGGTESENEASSALAVKAQIKKLITNEDPKKPLSDNKIAELLKKQNIDCARRTVAKYREAMQIPATHERRQTN